MQKFSFSASRTDRGRLVISSKEPTPFSSQPRIWRLRKAGSPIGCSACSSCSSVIDLISVSPKGSPHFYKSGNKEAVGIMYVRK